MPEILDEKEFTKIVLEDGILKKKTRRVDAGRHNKLIEETEEVLLVLPTAQDKDDWRGGDMGQRIAILARFLGIG